MEREIMRGTALAELRVFYYVTARVDSDYVLCKQWAPVCLWQQLNGAVHQYVLTRKAKYYIYVSVEVVASYLLFRFAN